MNASHSALTPCPECGRETPAAVFCIYCRAPLTIPALIPTVTVTHIVGPLWTIDTRAVTVPDGPVEQAVLDLIRQHTPAPPPWRVVVTDGEQVSRLAVRGDGRVVAAGDNPDRWAACTVAPASADALPPIPAPVRARGSETAATVMPSDPVAQPASVPASVVVGVHAGAGASTWATLLQLPEQPSHIAASDDTPIVLVCRSTPAGIEAAKHAVRRFTPARIRAALIIADAQGKPVRAALREQKVLAGAVRTVPVPWLPKLRGVTDLSPSLVEQLARPAKRITTALHRAHTQKETTK